MTLFLLSVVMPVFLVIGSGYISVRTGFFPDSGIDALNRFSQNFAIPCLLFVAVARIDLGAVIAWDFLFAFYFGATVCFALGILGARRIFGRRPGEAVAIGFGALFSNSVLLGLPITERAFGSEALSPNYAIVAFHAPYCYLIGISMMEAQRADGRAFLDTARVILMAVAKNALMVGIALGFVVNLTGLQLPEVLNEALAMVSRAALPVALFALGGVLTRYAIRDKLPEAGMIAILSLFVHPIITYGLAVEVFELQLEMTRSAVLTAAMAPGINAYIFASMYNRATDVNSAVVLLCTLFSVVTVPFWLTLLV